MIEMFAIGDFGSLNWKTIGFIVLVVITYLGLKFIAMAIAHRKK